MLKCAKCKKKYNYNMFHKNRCLYRGYDSYCIICRKLYNQMRHHKFKDENGDIIDNNKQINFIINISYELCTNCYKLSNAKKEKKKEEKKEESKEERKPKYNFTVSFD